MLSPLPMPTKKREEKNMKPPNMRNLVQRHPNMRQNMRNPNMRNLVQRHPNMRNPNMRNPSMRQNMGNQNQMMDQSTSLMRVERNQTLSKTQLYNPKRWFIMPYIHRYIW